MESQKLFKIKHINHLKAELKSGKLFDLYLKKGFGVDEEDIFFNPDILANEKITLRLPDERSNYDFENAKIIFNNYKSMNPVSATDIRIWTYLSHVTFLDYMRVRRPIESQPQNKWVDYILQHWFIESISATNLLRHDISLLWWGAYLSYDESREDPYELTEELFSMLDYTRHLLASSQGRNRQFTHAVLEFVKTNSDLFAKYKESRVRFIMRRLNYMGGYKIFSNLTKEDIIEVLNKYKKQIDNIQ